MHIVVFLGAKLLVHEIKTAPIKHSWFYYRKVVQQNLTPHPYAVTHGILKLGQYIFFLRKSVWSPAVMLPLH